MISRWLDFDRNKYGFVRFLVGGKLEAVIDVVELDPVCDQTAGVEPAVSQQIQTHLDFWLGIPQRVACRWYQLDFDFWMLLPASQIDR